MNESDFINNYTNRISTLSKEKQQVVLEKLTPLSESQKRIYSIENNLSDINNVTLIPLLISNKFNIRTIEKTLNFIARKHETLRTVFLEINGELRQLVLPYKEIKLNAKHLETPNQNEENEHIKNLISEIESERFNLTKEYLWKCHIYNLETSKYLVIFVFHQTIFDGLSLYIFLNELLTFQQFTENANNLKDSQLKIQYTDYVRWQKKSLSPDYLNRTKELWKTKLQNQTKNANIVPDHPRPQKSLCQAGEIETVFSDSQTNTINKFCSSNKITLPMLGAAILALSLFKTTKINETIIGIPIAGRTLPESEKIIGSFVNIAPLRIKINENETVRELLSAIKNEMLFIQENQEFPFRKILEALYPNQQLANYGATNQEPLLRIFLDYKGKNPANNTNTNTSDFSIFETVEKKTGCDIYLKLWENTNITLGFLYNAETFDPSTITDFINLYKNIFIKATENSELKINELIFRN